MSFIPTTQEMIELKAETVRLQKEQQKTNELLAQVIFWLREIGT